MARTAARTQPNQLTLWKLPWADAEPLETPRAHAHPQIHRKADASPLCIALARPYDRIEQVSLRPPRRGGGGQHQHPAHVPRLQCRAVILWSGSTPPRVALTETRPIIASRDNSGDSPAGSKRKLDPPLRDPDAATQQDEL